MSDSRRLSVLRAIVSDYVQTKEPVGSRILVERHRLGVSPATVRNDMAVLENEGFIQQPHTSAGRIPTDKGYRLFVDRLDEVKPLTVAERRAITQLLDDAVDIDDVVERTVRLLAQLTHQAAIVQYPVFRTATVRHLEFIQVSAYRLMVIVIMDTGRVDQHLLEIDEEIAAHDLEDIAHLVNKICVGNDVTTIRRAIEDLRDTHHIQWGSDTEKAPTLSLLEAVISALESGDTEQRIVMAGVANLTRLDTDFTKSIIPVVEALEEQVVLLKLFSEMSNDAPVAVSIGSEHGYDSLSEAAIVTSTYETTDGGQAHLGVVGPTRMDYPASIAAVRAVARYLSKILGTQQEI
ncbi:MAG: heat-inducible transcriptional repressor HrcA [Actinomycetaceae bacterium]|nr:heat-inducible transcriptional repressor HrcA [Actinomycetaceae bacterium]